MNTEDSDKTKAISEKQAALAKIERTLNELKAKADALRVEIFSLQSGIVPGSIVRNRFAARRFKVDSIKHDRRPYSNLQVHARQILKSGELSEVITPLYASDAILESVYERQQKELEKNKGRKPKV